MDTTHTLKERFVARGKRSRISALGSTAFMDVGYQCDCAEPTTFFGRPPFDPLARAASAFAALVTFPPLRPRATAAGFLRGGNACPLDGDALTPRLFHSIPSSGSFCVTAAHKKGRISEGAQGRRDRKVPMFAANNADGVGVFADADVGNVINHERIITKPLRFVKSPIGTGNE